jgi:hypothetical protein
MRMMVKHLDGFAEAELVQLRREAAAFRAAVPVDPDYTTMPPVGAAP